MEPPSSSESPASGPSRSPVRTQQHQHEQHEQHEQSDVSSWTYASPDLNVLLSGQLIDDNDHSGSTRPTARFKLHRGRESVHIEHPSLVTVHSTPTDQVLISVNTGKPILSIPLSPSSVDLPSQPSASSSSSPPSISSLASSGQDPLSIVTVHYPLVSRQQYDELVASSLYSSMFRVLLDGPEFLPPHFDPDATPPSTPHVTTPATRVAHSPTLQRALKSPLLSPQRRAHSQGSDASVPPLSLGVARARAPSLSGSSGRTTPSNQTNATSSASTTTPVGLYALMNQKPHLPLSTIHTNHVSQQTKQVAEEIVRLRKEQEAYSKRASLERDLLTARIEKASHDTLFPKKSPATPAKSAPSTAAGTSPATVQRGFPESQGIERGQNGLTIESAEKERSRDRLSREISEERGRSIRGPEAAKRDESISSRIRAEDEREQEERGRSRSRVRRGSRDESAASATGNHGAGDMIQARRSESRSGKAVAEVVAAVKGTSTGGLAAPATNQDVSSASRSRSPYKAGDVISATLDDEGDLGGDDTPDSITPSTSVTTNSAPQPQPSATASSTRRKSLEDGTTIDGFVPSVNALVAIPETEELALEEEENGRRGRDVRAREQPTTKEGTSPIGDDEDEEEHDAPFEMDEDIDVEDQDQELGSPPTSTASVPMTTSDLEPAAVTAMPASPQVTASTSYRPSSFRPSTLSSSYAALLQTSLARQQQQQHNYQQHASFKSPLTSATSISSPPNASSSSFRIPPLDLSAAISTSPPDSSHATSTTAKEDAQIAMLGSPRDQVDPKAMKQGEQKLREVLAIDAPSHRSPLPRRGQRVASSGSRSSRGGPGEDPSDDEHDEGERAGQNLSRFAVGSLPISIGMGQPRRGGGLFNGEVGAGGRDGERERELQRKTSVPVREGMFVPPFYPKKEAKNSTATTTSSSAATAVPFDLGPSRPRSASTSKNAAGSITSGGSGLLATSLARSSRTFFPPTHEQGQGAARTEPGNLGDLGRRGSINRAGTTTEAISKTRIAEDEEDDEDEEGFVPPHEMVKVGRSDEELLSRSVDDY